MHIERSIIFDFFSVRLNFISLNAHQKWFIIYKVIKYRKILIKYNAYLKNAVFHSRENIKSCISQP